MAVTTTLTLASPQDSELFRIEADSSDFASRAILSQQLPGEEKWHPVAFYNKSLSPVERNYEIHDKEMLAIIRVLEEWRHFLEGGRHLVEIWTDHKNLEYFMMAKKLSPSPVVSVPGSLRLQASSSSRTLHGEARRSIAETGPWQRSLRQRRHGPPTTGAHSSLGS